mmetsp:Transcript_21161/g.49627  ORF Transcript_21161/g.49627 Transcript_21161/m.49627 type:complete len:300 (-) Transcript_21161:3579-4478(-)
MYVRTRLSDAWREREKDQRGHADHEHEDMGLLAGLVPHRAFVCPPRLFLGPARGRRRRFQKCVLWAYLHHHFIVWPLPYRAHLPGVHILPQGTHRWNLFARHSDYWHYRQPDADQLGPELVHTQVHLSALAARLPPRCNAPRGRRQGHQPERVLHCRRHGPAGWRHPDLHAARVVPRQSHSRRVWAESAVVLRGVTLVLVPQEEATGCTRRGAGRPNTGRPVSGSVSRGEGRWRGGAGDQLGKAVPGQRLQGKRARQGGSERPVVRDVPGPGVFLARAQRCRQDHNHLDDDWHAPAVLW